MSPALIFLCGSLFGGAVVLVGLKLLEQYQRRHFMRTGAGSVL